jgi:hypothetical protein
MSRSASVRIISPVGMLLLVIGFFARQEARPTVPSQDVAGKGLQNDENERQSQGKAPRESWAKVIWESRMRHIREHILGPGGKAPFEFHVWGARQ